jgi:hypothetical protein
MRLIKWFIDASYAVHPDMKNHTGGYMMLGKGIAYGASTKQKLNSKSSTESELVGISDVMPQVLWTRYFLEFLEVQGCCHMSDSIVYQDNQSTMLLEKNGRGSSSKRTRHINIRFCFVADHIVAGKGKIEYCLTGGMLADYFTKLLQGSNFQKFQKQILNLKSDPDQKSAQIIGSLSNQINQQSVTTGQTPTTQKRTSPGPLP